MRTTTAGALLLITAVAAGFAPRLAAQSQLPSVVQLPSIQTFYYSGTVVVPDSGSAYLGGNSRSAHRSSRRGLGGGLGRGFGFSLGSPQASASATIIDNNEIDRQLLGGTPQQFLGRGKLAKSKTLDPTEEGKSLVRFARQQYREGNKTASFDTYRMAIEVLNGRLRELATVEFRRVFGTAADQTLRMASRRR